MSWLDCHGRGSYFRLLVGPVKRLARKPALSIPAMKTSQVAGMRVCVLILISRVLGVPYVEKLGCID